MKSICKSLLIVAAIFATALPLLAKPPQTEAELIAALDSPKEKIVFAALQDLEKQYPTSAPALAKIKTLLTDPRPLIHEKAARVLGALHADVSDADLKSIAAMLDSADKKEIQEALKALRGLKAQSVIPKIVSLLQHADPFVKRDACRTLAVVADKSVIPSIEPLLKDADPKVVKDANDAIFALKAK
ncbi:MAG: HEAT repeat domain-containing protein [Verrucomicrobiae bacterium]|nr:HEAT repeat domain-containing protein [Verrucomicrobiae bacterium]